METWKQRRRWIKLLLAITIFHNFWIEHALSASLSFDHPDILYVGRHQVSDQSATFDWSSAGVAITFEGRGSVSAVMNGRGNFFSVSVNGQSRVFKTDFTSSTYPLAQDLPQGHYTVMLTKVTEASYFGSSIFMNQGVVDFLGFDLDDDMRTVKTARPIRRLEFFGDSNLTGFGVSGNRRFGTWKCLNGMLRFENSDLTYAAKLGKMLQAEVHIEAWSGKGVYKNAAGITSRSDEPMPIHWPQALGSKRESLWNFSSWKPHAVLFHLGANDYSSWPTPDDIDFITAYQRLIVRMRTSYGSPELPVVALCGGGSTPNASYCSKIRTAVDELDGVEANIFFIEIPEDIFTEDDMACMEHRSESGHQKIAEFLQPKLRILLGW